MLKEKLIRSIEALRQSSLDIDSINGLLASIKEKDINDFPLDYWKALRLIFVIYLRWPDVRTNPNATHLIALGHDCIKQTEVLMPQINLLLQQSKQSPPKFKPRIK